MFGKVKRYLTKLGIGCREVGEKDLLANLPIYYAGALVAREMEFLDERCLWVVPQVQDLTPDFLIDIARAVEAHCHRRTLFCLEISSREFCEYLRRKEVWYVVPGRQAYLPPRVILESDRAYSSRQSECRATLSVRAQVFLIWLLNQKTMSREYPYRQIGEILGYPQFAITRLAQELQSLGLARIVYKWPEAAIGFDLDRDAIWVRASKLMRSPVAKVVRMKHPPQGLPLAGVTALSRQTDLMDDGPTVFACERQQLKDVSTSELSRYEGFVVQCWRYDPRLIANEADCVDPISLYLSLKDDDDPRVDLAREELLRKVF